MRSILRRIVRFVQRIPVMMGWIEEEVQSNEPNNGSTSDEPIDYCNEYCNEELSQAPALAAPKVKVMVNNPTTSSFPIPSFILLAAITPVIILFFPQIISPAGAFLSLGNNEIVVGILVGGVVGVGSWVCRVNGYVISMLGWVVGGPLGIVVSYISSLLLPGWVQGDMIYRLGGVAIGLFLPITRLPLMVVIVFYVVIDGCKGKGLFYSIGSGMFLGLMGVIGGAGAVMIAMVALSVINSSTSYGQSSLDAMGDAAQSKGNKTDVGSILRLNASVYGSVGVGHEVMGSRLGVDQRVVTTSAMALEIWNARALLISHEYQATRTGLAEILSNSFFAIPQISGIFIIAVVVGIIVALSISYVLGQAPMQPALEGVINLGALGMLSAFNPMVIALALGGAFILRLIPSENKDGTFTVMPLIGN